MADKQQAYQNTRDDGAFRFLGIPSLVRASAETTNGAFGLIEQWEMPPGFASPHHTHHREDESFYVLEGEIAFVCGGDWFTTGPGSFAYGPREIPHGFKVIGNAPARMLVMCNPGGFEQFVLEQQTPISEPPSAPDMGRLMTLAAQFGIDILGPLPQEPEGFGCSGPAVHDLKSLNLQWIKAFNKRDWKSESSFRSADFRAELSGIGSLDSAAWGGFMSGFTSAFPDSQISVESCIAEGDKVVLRWVLSGTHQGEFQGIPATGRPVKFVGIEVNRSVDGKIVDHHCNLDNIALLQRLGAMPA